MSSYAEKMDFDILAELNKKTKLTPEDLKILVKYANGDLTTKCNICQYREDGNCILLGLHLENNIVGSALSNWTYHPVVDLVKKARNRIRDLL